MQASENFDALKSSFPFALAAVTTRAFLNTLFASLLFESNLAALLAASKASSNLPTQMSGYKLHVNQRLHEHE